MKLANGGNGATVYILSWEITQYNRLTQFFLCCGGVFLLYIVYGYLQELIFTDVAFKSFGWFLTLIQFGYYICFGFIERNIRGRVNGLNGRTMERAIPIRIYVILAALTLGTMGLSNSSLRYINFPTQVIFKCCKLIPVLVGSIIVQGKRYGILDFVAASLMCIGLAWFALVDSHISPSFHVMGVAMILGALLCDAMIGNVQEKAMRDYNGNSAEVVLYSYGFGFMYLLVILAMTGHLLDGLLFSFENYGHVFGYGFLFSLSGYVGIHFVLALVRIYDATVAATVTTARKAVTIILSFIFFRKPFAIEYVWSGMLVVLGIYLNVFNKKYKLTVNDVLGRILALKTFQPSNSTSNSRKYLLNI